MISQKNHEYFFIFPRNDEIISSQLIKLSILKKLEIENPKEFFQLIYTFSNNDYLFESYYVQTYNSGIYSEVAGLVMDDYLTELEKQGYLIKE